MAGSCRHVTSLTDPAVTHALEFTNGKVMLGKMDTLKEVNWAGLMRKLPEEELRQLLKKCRLIACVNWTMLSFMNEILIGLGRVLEGLEGRRMLFIDLTDPAKRSREDIGEVLDILAGLQDAADVILGMNKNESGQVAQVLGIASTDDLQYRAEGIRNRLDLSLVVIHPSDCAYAADHSNSWHAHGPYTPRPLLTTGAGDVFNSGFRRRPARRASPRDALGVGVSASGFYVRNCRPASRKELVTFIRNWAQSIAATCLDPRDPGRTNGPLTAGVVAHILTVKTRPIEKLRVPPASNPHRTMNPAETSTAPKKMILLIDDELSLLRVHQRGLTTLGYHVLTASSGEEGLHLLAENSIDLVVLDMLMPRMDGVENPAYDPTAHPGTEGDDPVRIRRTGEGGCGKSHGCAGLSEKAADPEVPGRDHRRSSGWTCGSRSELIQPGQPPPRGPRLQPATPPVEQLCLWGRHLRRNKTLCGSKNLVGEPVLPGRMKMEEEA